MPSSAEKGHANLVLLPLWMVPKVGLDMKKYCNGFQGRMNSKTRFEKSSPLLNYREEQVRPSTPPQVELKTVGLFAGIGGIELGLHKAGHETRLLCENDPGAEAVLRAQFRESEIRQDIRDLRSLPKETTLLAAGFPCQDLSQAGATKGISGARSGLVGEVFRLLRRKRVPWVLIENVPFMLRLGRGKALDVIVNELESMGYKWAYRVVDSQAFGLPQRRQRVYLLASIEHDPRDVLFADEAGPPESGPDPSDVACGFYWTEGVRGLGWAVDAVPTLKGGSTIGIPSPPAICFPDGRIIKPDIRDAERLQGFPSDWTKPAEKVVRGSFRWRLVGNAVSVNVSTWIGRRLAEPGHYDGMWDSALAPGTPWPKAAWNLGEGRHVAELSLWPIRKSRKPLHEFLRHPGQLLSQRATAGFRSRTRTARLRFPDGFLDTVDAHLTRMSQGAEKEVSQERGSPPA